MEIEESSFSYYPYGISKIIPSKNITIPEFIEIIKEENKQIDKIRAEPDRDLRQILKRGLPYVTFGGTFTKRSKNGLKKSSGLACFDIDDIEGIENLNKIKDQLIKNKYTHCLFLSPSGNGFKVVVKIPKVKNDEEYKKYWTAIARHYNLYQNDEAGKDISRACYISVDKKPYLNLNSEIYQESKERVEDISLSPEIKDIKEKIIKTSVTKEYLNKNIIPKIDITTLDLICNPKSNEELQQLGYSSRSERDERIITTLLLNGFGQYIYSIFDNFPCGDKYNEHQSPDKYLQASIDKARIYSGVQNDSVLELENELNDLPDRVLKNKLDEFILKISKIENKLIQKKIIGSIAFRLTISKKEILERLNELVKGNEQKKPISVSSMLDKEIPKIEFFINPLIPKGSIIAIGGKAGKGKSLIAEALCIYSSLNIDFLNTFKIEQTPKILLYDLENGETTLHYRLKYILNGLNSSHKVLNNFDVVYDFNKNNIQKEIELSKDYDVIILDSYRRFLEGTENDSEVTDKFFKEYLKPLKELGKTIIILHHFKKSNPEEFTDDVLMDLFRGSSDIPAQFDLIFGIFKSPEKQELNGNLHYDVSIAKIKNRLGLPIKDFMFKVTKDDSKQATYLKFIDFSKLRSQKEQVLDRIIELLTLNDELKRSEIISKIFLEFECGRYNTMKYLTELIKDKVVTRSKLGVYVLTDKVILIKQGEEQATIK